jgi:hypothetical protein
MQVLNKILVHMGFPHARNFTENLIGKVNGFSGKYTGFFPASFSPKVSPQLHSPSEHVSSSIV